MKRQKTKEELRAELEAEMASYFEQGGEVTRHAQGERSVEFRSSPIRPALNLTPQETRTPVTDAIANIDARKKRSHHNKHKRRQRVDKILLLDDFGEPLRWIHKP